jgi:hypothetical protein
MIILFILGFSFPREYTRGVVQTIEASFCMELCSMYQLIPDTGYTYTNLTATPIIIKTMANAKNSSPVVVA